MDRSRKWRSAKRALDLRIRKARRGAQCEIKEAMFVFLSEAAAESGIPSDCDGGFLEKCAECETREAMFGFLSEVAAKSGIPSDFDGGFLEECAERYNSVLDSTKPLGLLSGLGKICAEELSSPRRFSEKIASSEKFDISFRADFVGSAMFYVVFLVFGKEKLRLAELLEEPGSPYRSVLFLPPEPGKIARFLSALKTRAAPFVDSLFASKIEPWDELREKMLFENARTLKILDVEAAGIEALLSGELEDFSEKGRVGRGLENFRVRYQIGGEKFAVAFVPRGFGDAVAFASAFRAFVETGKAGLDGVEFFINNW